MGPGTRTVIVVIVVGGSLLFVAPGVILASTGGASVAPRPGVAVGVLLGLAGLAVSAWSIWCLAVVGRGIPNPLDPPRALVTVGPYRWVRNPMALGYAVVLLGEAAFFGSVTLAALALAALVAVHLLVVLHEEPAGRRRFGADFEAYCAEVPRWIPRLGARAGGTRASADR